jgi:hypothetical protein
MRGFALLIGPLTGLALGLLWGAPTSAGPLTSATLTIHTANKGFPDAIFAGVANPGYANGTGLAATWTLPSGALATGASTATLASTVAPPLTKAVWTVGPNVAAAFSAGGPNAMAIPAGWSLQAYGGFPLLAFDQPPIGSPATATLLATGVQRTAVARSWTTGTAVVTLSTSNAALTFSAQGSNTLVNGAGSVTLVSPFVVFASTASPTVYFAELHLTFVPEPSGTLVLASAGALLLAWRGRRVRR